MQIYGAEANILSKPVLKMTTRHSKVVTGNFGNYGWEKPGSGLTKAGELQWCSWQRGLCAGAGQLYAAVPILNSGLESDEYCLYLLETV